MGAAISAETIIDGGGLVTLDGAGISRLLTVDNHVSLTAIGLTFTNGFATTEGEDRQSGGAIRGGWQGAVSVFDCSFLDNSAGDEGEEGGGAIYVPSQSRLRNSILSANTSGNDWGGGLSCRDTMDGSCNIQ